MFLVTTSLKKAWIKSKETLFLGDWCNKDVILKDNKNLKHKTVTYHWDNRNIFINDNQLIESIYEKYLLILSSKLNSIHNKNYSIRFWRIVIGLWLRYFIEIIFDRYKSINFAQNDFKVTETLILKYNLNNWIPLNYQEFHKQTLLDEWNHIIYSEIIKFNKVIPYKTTNEKLENDYKDINYSLPKRIIKKLIIFSNKAIPIFFKKTFFVNSIISLKDISILQIKLGQFPNLFQLLVSPVKIKRKKINKELRKLINLNEGESGFEKIIDYLIPQFIPLAYLESFNQANKDIKKVYPNKVDKIYTANAYSYDEAFKIWTGRQVERGSKLIIGQHGGRAGIALILQSHLHQIKISDHYISWGWKGESEKIIPLPSIKLSNLDFTHKNDGRIVVFLPSYQKYFYHSSSMPIAGQCNRHFEEQLSVLNYLNNDIKNNYFFRIGPREDNFNIKSRLRQKNINKIDNIESFIDSVNSSRILIHTDNSTSLLQTMSSNFPSLIFWNPRFYELTDEAKPYFDEFYKMGIMHHEPESLAKKLNEVYFDINSWWNDSNIQNIRNEFSKNFCLTKNNYFHDWVSAINNIK